MKCPKCETVNPADSKFCRECAPALQPFTGRRPAPKAVEKLEKAESLLLGNYGESWNLTVLENALYLDALAQAHYRSGKLGPAKARYEKIASTGLFRFEPDIWVKSFYWLGRIAEEQGKKDEARGHYEKFLDLWKDADPGLTEAEEARRRLAGSQSR